MMHNYIALLRGINVGGQKKIKMADLRETLIKTGLNHVETYIQSGNVVFRDGESNKRVLESRIHKAILDDFGFEVPVLVVLEEDIKGILDNNPFDQNDEGNKLYYVLLKEPPGKDVINEFNELHFEQEDFYITDACVYLLCKKGYGNAKLSNNLVEQKLKVEATTRNLRTMQKLLDMVQKK
jgi:uncharacterized protein (DUF1697 family)